LKASISIGHFDRDLPENRIYFYTTEPVVTRRSAMARLSSIADQQLLVYFIFAAR
jgi:hypothetical protein